jgi:type II secretory pathway pseudopilin PulG
MEMMVVLVLLSIIALILYPVLMAARPVSAENKCSHRLKQVALAMELYRADHDGKGIIGVAEIKEYQYPWNHFYGLVPYLKDGNLVWCVIPSEPSLNVSSHYQTRFFLKLGVPSTRRSAAPDPTHVAVYCKNHARGEIVPDASTNWAKERMREGDYLFVREDFSRDTTPTSMLETWFYRNGQWSQTISSDGVQAFMKFPGENWPPVSE